MPGTSFLLHCCLFESASWLRNCVKSDEFCVWLHQILHNTHTRTHLQKHVCKGFLRLATRHFTADLETPLRNLKCQKRKTSTSGEHKRQQTNNDGRMKLPLCSRRPGTDPHSSQLLRTECESEHAAQLVVKKA